MKEDIYITGWGIISALGVGVEATKTALLEKRSGIGRMQYLQSAHSELPVGEVKLSDREMCEILGIAPTAITTRTSLMASIAIGQALASAKLTADNTAERVALVSGTTVGGMEKSEQYYKDFLTNDSRNDYIKSHDCGSCTEMSADQLGCFDMLTTISTACSSAANAIVLGANLIRSGRYQTVVVGGSECLTRFHLNGFNTLMILDREPCRPFDATRAGLNLGEGAAYLVLETKQAAEQRGVEPLGKLSGYGNACDAFHQTASSPDGEGAYLSMQKALKMSGLAATDIDYINAHGTGTANNDLSEGAAVMRVFGRDSVPPISSTKSFTGHTTSASGSIEAVISILALRENFTPVNLNFGKRIEELSFSPVTEQHSGEKEIRNVLTNSFGFGGNDTSCIFSKI